MFFHHKFLQWGFGSMNILLKCLKWNASEGIIIILETRPSKSAQKNIIKSIKFYWKQTPSKKKKSKCSWER